MNEKLLQRVEEAMREADDYYISQEQIWAGVVAVLEEAAKVAENKANKLAQHKDVSSALQAATAEDIAEEIRMLKT
jgi:hypothetical protein